MMQSPDSVNGVRLAHFLALAGVCSRRQAARLIQQQRVSVNGTIGVHHQRISLSDHEPITLDGQPITLKHHPIYWLYHKPIGIDCRLLDNDASSLRHRLPASTHCYPVGRLDKDSRGLLLISNDGELTQRLMHPAFAHQKHYQVRVDKPFNHNFLELMAAGVDYGEGLTKACEVRQLGPELFAITLTEGKKRQIRRMCRHFGFRVIDLLRTHIGELALGKLPEGCFRALTAAEIQLLNTLKVAV
ncbi:hypothetical protein HR45_10290 [Shewanella mangrovi]|uniref:Pseudouridine synthase n=1 Tax=Shewanella mangrovi TaxID=1515746 RepID=A0A094JBZ4_9GAMM|nr:pseudouridine synthase [Shewanella mangrovi]KFZ37400.1 hypothetical protein HR45_10290 [Shewanella mangrovi]